VLFCLNGRQTGPVRVPTQRRFAFSRMDVRLAHKLLELSHGAVHVASTRQQLASGLGTAREVISRILAEFQRRGWFSPTRGHIASTTAPETGRPGMIFVSVT